MRERPPRPARPLLLAAALLAYALFFYRDLLFSDRVCVFRDQYTILLAIDDVRVAVEGAAVPPDLPAAMAGTVRIAAYRPQEVELAARMETPGLVVLTDTFYPGWAASVDDEPAPIVRANYFARGVYVEAGEHRVVFRYAPMSHRLGMLLSLLTGAGMLVGVFTSARQRRMLPYVIP